MEAFAKVIAQPSKAVRARQISFLMPARAAANGGGGGAKNGGNGDANGAATNGGSKVLAVFPNGTG